MPSTGGNRAGTWKRVRNERSRFAQGLLSNPQLHPFFSKVVLFRCIGERPGPSRSQGQFLGGENKGKARPHPPIHVLRCSPSRLRLLTKAKTAEMEGYVDFQKAFYSPDLRPRLELFEIRAATMITAVAWKSFDLFKDSQTGKSRASKTPIVGNPR